MWKNEIGRRGRGKNETQMQEVLEVVWKNEKR